VRWIRSKSCFLIDFEHKATRLGRNRYLGSSDGNSKHIRTFEQLVDALMFVAFGCLCWIRSKSCFVVDFEHKASRLGRIHSLGSSDGNSKRIRAFERLVDALMFEMHYRSTLDAFFH